MTNLTAALKFLKQNPDVTLFPARWEGGHNGLVKWGTESTNDLDIIKSWAEKYNNMYFCVDLRKGHSPLRVIDVDVKDGKDGVASLKAAGTTPPTLRVKTPSGGYHLFYASDDCPNFLGRKDTSPLGRGVDMPVMVPVPGSDVPNKGTYKIIADQPVAALPDWVTEKALAAKTAEAKVLDTEVELDKPHNVDRAIHYLLHRAPEATQGDSGDETTFTVAAQLKDYGLSQQKAYELMLEYWNDEKASPPWSPYGLETKVRNAYEYGQNSPGCDTPEALFPPVTNSTSMIRCASEIKPSSLKPRPWLLGYRYLPGYVTATVAPGGVGKSILTIMEAISVATNKQLTYDKPKIKSNVWIYNLEDPFDELERRILATAKHHDIHHSNLNGVYYTSGYDQPLVLVTDNGKQGVTVNESIIQHMIEHITKRDIKLLVVDPFVRCHQVSENDNMAIDKVVQQFQRIAKETDCAISLVHHTNKGKDHAGNMDSARGASSFMSAARIGHTLVTMTEKEAKDYAIPSMRRSWYVKLDDAKANLAPPSAETKWFERQSVKLMFDSDETTGTLQRVELAPVTLEEEDDLYLGMVGRNAYDGCSVSEMAKKISELKGKAKGYSYSSVRRKIIELFGDNALKIGTKVFKIEKTPCHNGEKKSVFRVNVDVNELNKNSNDEGDLDA